MRLSKEQFVQMFGEKALKEPEKKPKYRNKQCFWKGKKFDSIRERDRFIILESEQSKGKISDLQTQVKFNLIPEQRDNNGEMLERACDYVADFTYTEDGQTVVEDAKGVRTKEYVIKRKLMLWVHGLKIREV